MVSKLSFKMAISLGMYIIYSGHEFSPAFWFCLPACVQILTATDLHKSITHATEASLHRDKAEKGEVQITNTEETEDPIEDTPVAVDSDVHVDNGHETDNEEEKERDTNKNWIYVDKGVGESKLASRFRNLFVGMIESNLNILLCLATARKISGWSRRFSFRKSPSICSCIYGEQ